LWDGIFSDDARAFAGLHGLTRTALSPVLAHMSLTDFHPVSGSVVEVAARALVAMAAGALIGVERQWHHRAAGIRTHALLAVASVLLAAVLTIQFPLRWAEDRLGRIIGSLPPSSPWEVRMHGTRQAVERLWARCLDGRTDATAVNRVAIRTRREGDDLVLVAELTLSDAEALTVVALGE